MQLIWFCCIMIGFLVVVCGFLSYKVILLERRYSILLEFCFEEQKEGGINGFY